MRLREVFPGGRPEEPPGPDAERGLAAVDAALAGRPVDADFDELATLARELVDERELPDPEFAARLDRWAADGFPSGRSPDPRTGDGGSEASGLARMRQRLAAAQPRRIVAPAAAGLILVVIAAVAISHSGEIGGSQGQENSSSDTSTSAAGGQANQVRQQENAPGGGVRSEQSAARVQALGDKSTALPSSGTLDQVVRPADVPFGRHRIERTVDLTLATAPERFRDAADGVLDVVEQHHGYVRSSNVSEGGASPSPAREGAQARGQARFDLRIPAGQLEATLGDLSDLGHIVSREDGTVDVTSRFLGTHRRIAALEQTRANLLRQLADAVTVTEQESIKRRLEIVESQLSQANADLADLQHRVRLVPVGVTITADSELGGAGGGGSWSIGDALDDARRVLEVAVGVLLISAAVLVPVGLVALLAWLAAREIARRRRESALD
jgi:hypothetical protein